MTSRRGFVKVPRSVIADADLSPGDLGAFVMLVARAALADRTVVFLGREWPVQRGRLRCSLSALGTLFGMSVPQVRALLRRLEARRLISTATSKHGTLLTVCNFNDFSGEPHAERTELADLAHMRRRGMKKGEGEKQKDREHLDLPEDEIAASEKAADGRQVIPVAELLARRRRHEGSS